jgi:hypothetical protein
LLSRETKVNATSLEVVLSFVTQQPSRVFEGIGLLGFPLATDFDLI